MAPDEERPPNLEFSLETVSTTVNYMQIVRKSLEGAFKNIFGGVNAPLAKEHYYGTQILKYFHNYDNNESWDNVVILFHRKMTETTPNTQLNTISSDIQMLSSYFNFSFFGNE